MKGKTLLSLGGIMMLIVIFVIGHFNYQDCMITNDCSVLLYALMQMHMLLKILKEKPKRNKVLKMQHFVKKKKIILSIVGPFYPET